MADHRIMRDVENKESPVWVKRIDVLLEDKNMSQKELSARSGVSEATISDWIGAYKKGKQSREPKILGFQAVAKALGVSTDYLLGEDQCKTPQDEEIHKIIGLSDGAISKLKRAQVLIAKGNVSAEKKFFILNYLIENISKADLLEDLYDYLFGEFSFRNKNNENLLGADFIISRSPSGKETELLTFSEIFSQASFADVQRDLVRLKDKIEEEKKKKEKADYEIWKDSEEAKALNEEFWEMIDNEQNGRESK